jgi:hypothetical protein
MIEDRNKRRVFVNTVTNILISKKKAGIFMTNFEHLGNRTEYLTAGSHTARRQQSIFIYCTAFIYNIRRHISSLRGTQELPEDGNKLPKHVGAKG